MKARFPFVAVLGVTLVSFGFLIGCGQQDPVGSDPAVEPVAEGEQAAAVDPHDVPLTDEQKRQLREETAQFADAIARIKLFRDTIEQETSAGIPENPFAAHQALDRVDLLVQWLPEIARNSEVPKEHWEAVTTAANELRESFDTIHLNIDNKLDPGFASVKEQIDAKLAGLEAIAGQ